MPSVNELFSNLLLGSTWICFQICIGIVFSFCLVLSNFTIKPNNYWNLNLNI